MEEKEESEEGFILDFVYILQSDHLQSRPFLRQLRGNCDSLVEVPSSSIYRKH